MPVISSCSMNTRGSRIDIQLLDYILVLHHDGAAPYLLRAGEFIIVGVQLLVEEGKPLDLGHLGQVLIDASYLLGSQLIYLWIAGEVLEGGEGGAIDLGPAPNVVHIDLDQGDDVWSLLADHHRFSDIGAKLQLVFNECWREARAIGELQN